MAYIKTRIMCKVSSEKKSGPSSTYSGFLVADDANPGVIARAFESHKQVIIDGNPQLTIDQISIIDIILE